MRKLLLVVLVGMVLAMDMCGIVKEIITFIETRQEVEDDMDGVATIVYVEE